MPESTTEKFRNEMKYFINNSDIYELKNRLRFVMRHDGNSQADGRYKIRSLYYDDINNSALHEKEDGVTARVKFRIRCYNDDYSFIRLEKKLKRNSGTLKTSSPLSREEAEALISGNYRWLAGSADQVKLELFYYITSKAARPKTIVDYTREAFTYRPGNVRVTIDSDVRTGLLSTDFFNPNLSTFRVFDEGLSILEIKYDEFLPDNIRLLLQLGNRLRGQASKYAAGRLYI